MRRCAYLAAVIFAVVLLSACGPKFPTEEPDIEGLVTTADIGDSSVTLLIEVPDDEREPAWSSKTALDKASVTVPQDALVFDSDGDEVELPRIAVKGVRLRAWFTGAVAESYPVQAQARAVQLVDTP